MQENIGPIPHWMQLALTALASILSTIGIDRLYNNWLNRKKPAAEIEVSHATATEITVRASSAAGDALSRMMDRLDLAQTTIDGLRGQIVEWRNKAEELDGQLIDSREANALLKSEMANYEHQIKTMKATLTLNEKNYDGSQDAKPPDFNFHQKTNSTNKKDAPPKQSSEASLLLSFRVLLLRQHD